MSTKTIRILLVEDNPGDARLLQELLKETKSIAVKITEADRVETALRKLTEEDFDLILLDLNLPDSQGLATFSCMHEHIPNMPFILLTGFDDESLAVSAVQKGAQDYLIKGRVDGNLLTRSIRYAIERQRLLVEMESARLIEQHLAYHDALTNLPNRLLFYDRLAQALAYANRYSGHVAVLFLDLDGFKTVNDSKGHATGDQLLKALAERLKRNVRESDTIARLGGDEFTILLKGVKNVADIVLVAQKVIRLLTSTFEIGNYKIKLTASVGISIYPYDGDDSETLMKKADFAMYRAKQQGKNAYQLFNVSIDNEGFQRLSLEKHLRRALSNHELLLNYQPQIDLRTGQMTGIEALVRWEDPERGLVPPMDFIPLAEESGLIVPIGEWVLKRACLDNKKWQDAGLPRIPVAINLSARQFREIGLSESISSVLKETELNPEYLMMEITETNAMQDVDYTVSTLETLKKMGVQIALDDFGTGYSSLSYLKKFPIDLLKIDKSFINEVPSDQDDSSITSAIVALTHSLGMRAIAEGVETDQQLQFLKSIYCDQIQGFYFSRPVAAEELTKLLRDGLKLPTALRPRRQVKVI